MTNMWQTITLHQLGTFAKGSGVSKSDLVPDGVRAIRYGELYTTYNTSIHDVVSRISSDHASTCYRIERGDILFPCSGETAEDIGRPAVYLHDAECYAGGDIIVLRPTSGDPLFLAYALNGADAVRFRAVRAKGHTVVHIYADDLGDYRLPLPPLPEQQKIAAILSTWDRAIGLTEKLIAAKQRRKAALIHQLLTGKVRLPAFGGSPVDSHSRIASLPAAVWRGIYPPSVQPGIPKIAVRPRGWEETTMEELLHVQKRSVELEDDKVYQLVVAKRNRGGIEPREKLPGREIKTPTQFAVHQGDFVISRRQIIHGACGVVPPSLDGAIVSNEYAVCRVNGKLNIDFLKYLTHTLYFQQTCFHASVGVALEKMIFRLERWLTFPFVIPPISEQEAIAKLLVSADAEIELHEKKLDALRRQKRGLMQQLLTGKVRVKVRESSGE